MRRINLLTTFLAFTIMAGVAHAGEQKPREEKRFAFEMRGLRWKKVLEWLSDQSGLPYATNYAPPPGTFTFISPTNGKTPRTYTLPEVIDQLNDSLSMHGYLLVRRNASITIAPADDIIDQGLAPHVELADLNSRGRTELVSISLPIERIGSADAREVRKLMGRFGSVVVLAESKRIVLRDTVENLQRILKITAPENPRPKIEPDPMKPMRENKDFAENLVQKGAPMVTSTALNFVRLVGIMKTPTSYEAVLLDLTRTKREIPLSAAPGSSQFRVKDLVDENKTAVSGHVLRIDVREMYFQADNEVYRLEIGDTLRTALVRPLSNDELRELGLKRVND